MSRAARARPEEPTSPAARLPEDHPKFRPWSSISVLTAALSTSARHATASQAKRRLSSGGGDGEGRSFPKLRKRQGGDVRGRARERADEARRRDRCSRTLRSGKVRSVQVDAHAFWLRAPGCGEIRPVTLPEPGPDDVVVRTVRSGVSRGTETLVFRGGVPPDQHAGMRAPFQEGDFPGPVKYGYLNVGAVEQGPPELSGRTVFCLYPHQTAYVVPAAPCPSCRRASHPPVPCSRVPSRPPSMRCGTPPRSLATGSRSSAPGWSAAASHDCSAGFRPCRSPSWTSILAGLGRRGRPRRRLRPPGRRRRRPRPGRAHECDLRRAPALARPARPEGTVIDLSWYGDTEVRLSLGGAFHTGRLGIRSSQVGHPLPGPRRASHDGRPAGARTRPAARPCLRRAPHRGVPLRRAARGDGPAGRWEPAGALPHHHLRRGVERVQRDRPRSHDDRP